MTYRNPRAARPPDPSLTEGLDGQFIIRFPPDIAERLNSEPFDSLDIHFTDSRHATVNVFGETLSAILLWLPTAVETYRTMDGSHCYKSGDIDHFLIVHRPDSPPTEFSSSFVWDHGLTPPTADIIAKRAARAQAARSSESSPDIEYWDMVETQLLVLTGHSPGKPMRRTEEFDEPAIDPVVLEKILRSRGHPEFEGYSGIVVSESDVEQYELDVDNLSLHEPEEEEMIESSVSTEEKLEGEEEEEQEYEEESSNE